MNPYKYSLNESLEKLNQLDIDESRNALWDVLHIARWHKGIDWIGWIDNNNDLIDKLKLYDCFSSCPDELRIEISNSFRFFKNLDR